MRRRLWLAAIVGLMLTGTAVAQPCGPAQTGPIAISSNATLCFEPSADHSATDVAGQPKVASYSWGHYLPGAQAPVQEWNLGKPAPVNGAIRVQPAEMLTLPLDVLYEARVVAISPGGLRGVSDPTVPFYRSGAPGAPRRPVWLVGL